MTPDARPSEIRAAYLALAREHHPDFHADDPPVERDLHVRRMKAVTEAWDVLSHVDRRRQYDETLAGGSRVTSAGPASERQRVRPEVTVPAGKGWTPRTGDDGWMDDHAGWAAERDRIVPDTDAVDPTPHPARLVPVALFGAAMVCGFVGLAVQSRPMLAVAVVGVVVSSVLFMVMPLVTMTRIGRNRGAADAPSATARRTPFTGT